MLLCPNAFCALRISDFANWVPKNRRKSWGLMWARSHAMAYPCTVRQIEVADIGAPVARFAPRPPNAVKAREQDQNRNVRQQLQAIETDKIHGQNWCFL